MDKKDRRREDGDLAESLLIPGILADPIMGLTATDEAAALLLAEKEEDLED